MLFQNLTPLLWLGILQSWWIEGENIVTKVEGSWWIESESIVRYQARRIFAEVKTRKFDVPSVQSWWIEV